MPIVPNVLPVIEGYVLVRVLVDCTGYSAAQKIWPQDIKPKIGSAQSRASIQCGQIKDYDEHVRQCGPNWHPPQRPYLSGIEWHDINGVGPLYLDRVTNQASGVKMNPQDEPLAHIFWYIYKLSANGLTFERVAAQYP